MRLCNLFWSYVVIADSDRGLPVQAYSEASPVDDILFLKYLPRTHLTIGHLYKYPLT